MKRFIIAICLLMLLQISFSTALFAATTNNHYQTDPLAEYTGKYQVVQKRGTVGVTIELVNGDLVCTQSWDGEKLLLRHLTGDNFIMAGFDWSVKFLRDKDKKITQILVMGTDRWDKVKE